MLGVKRVGEVVPRRGGSNGEIGVLAQAGGWQGEHGP
jgi:hypothetical protein